MAYKLSGKILAIGQSENLTSRSGNTYTKRDLIVTVIKYDPYTGYPSEDTGNTPKFTFIGQRCQDLDGFKAGDSVTLGLEISGRIYNKDGRTEYLTDVRPVSVYRNTREQSAAPDNPVTPSAPQSGLVYQGPSDPFAYPPASTAIAPGNSFSPPFSGAPSGGASAPGNATGELGDDLPF